MFSLVRSTTPSGVRKRVPLAVSDWVRLVSTAGDAYTSRRFVLMLGVPELESVLSDVLFRTAQEKLSSGVPVFRFVET